MKINPEKELESSFLPVYGLVRNIIYSDYDRKNAHYTKMQIAILSTLYWHNEMCMSELAELISSSRAQMTRAITPLVEDNMVERFENKSNRKMVHIRLTETGRDFLREYLRIRFETLREKLNEGDAARLTEATRTIAEILCKLRNKKTSG